MEFIRSFKQSLFGLLIVLPLIVSGVSQAFPQSASMPPLFIDQDELNAYKAEFEKNPASLKNPLKKYLAGADTLLYTKPFTVTDKDFLPPSGDKRDFVSMGPYWWPDPAKPDGLPYIRKDGERNPEYYKYRDQDYFNQLIDVIQVLSNSYYVTGNIKYAWKAVEFINVWFVNENTRMNPNMNFAQFIPGRNEGRGSGLIETRYIYRITDAVVLLRASDAWGKNIDKQLNQWFEEYLNWMTTHKYGMDESKAKNNHGTWYDVQRTAISIFLGKIDAAKELLETAKEKRISSQITPEGKQPLELARTKSFNYSVMNLSAMMHLATMGEYLGIDLWNYTGSSGGSIKKALDYILPFAAEEDDWETQQLGDYKLYELQPILTTARRVYGDKEYSKWQRKVLGPETKQSKIGRKL